MRTNPLTMHVFSQAVCEKVIIEPKKMIRKLPRIQHLFAQLTGRLRNEEDEVTMLQFKLKSLPMKVTLFNSHLVTKLSFYLLV